VEVEGRMRVKGGGFVALHVAPHARLFLPTTQHMHAPSLSLLGFCNY